MQKRENLYYSMSKTGQTHRELMRINDDGDPHSPMATLMVWVQISLPNQQAIAAKEFAPTPVHLNS